MLVLDPFFGYITQQNRKKEVPHATRHKTIRLSLLSTEV
jgi:hypothetical protein